jgi:predicted DNA-binding antitoxin AbrB/MazE fold protein
MVRTLPAVYENGVLRPLEPLPLKDHQRVTVTITESPIEAAEKWLDHAYLASLESDDEPEPSLEQVRKLMAKLPGKLSDAVRAEREER